MIFAAKKNHFFPEAGLVCQDKFVCIIVTNYVNWHRGNLWLDTGNLKIQFEWVSGGIRTVVFGIPIHYR